MVLSLIHIWYISDEHFSEDSGYTNPEESEHDFFNVGHTSTSVSLATGLAKARDIKGDKENIIAIIGDGSQMCIRDRIGGNVKVIAEEPYYRYIPKNGLKLSTKVSMTCLLYTSRCV